MAKRKKYPRPKSGAWFIPVRGSYLPASSAGWLTYIPFVTFLVFTLCFGINHTSSAADAVIFIVPNWIVALALMTYIASKKS